MYARMSVLGLGLLSVSFIIQSNQSNIYDQFEQVIEKFKQTVEKQDIKAFKTLVNQCNSFAKDRSWRGILLSSYGDDLAGLKFLIEKGNMSVNEFDASGKTVLHDACQKGNAEVIEYLLRKKAYVNAYRIEKGNSYSFSPLDDALKYRICDKCIKLLVQHDGYANQDRVIEFFEEANVSISACQALKAIISPYAKIKLEKDFQETQQFIECTSSKKMSPNDEKRCKLIQERLDILQS